MKREDIIRMVHEAGILEYGYPVGERVAGELERFAALVAAAEREACATLADGQIERWVDDRARYASSECAAAIRARSTP